MDQVTLKEFLEYDRVSGNFRWLKSNSNRAKVGSIAGTCRPDGYVKIRLNGNQFLAHRLAWLWVYGYWPKRMIDHINRDRSDNRIENLRDVSNGVNQENRKARTGSSSGMVGVSRRSSGKWRASITIEKKFISLGSFATKEDARNAYLEAKKRYHTPIICGDCDELMIEEEV